MGCIGRRQKVEERMEVGHWRMLTETILFKSFVGKVSRELGIS